MSQHDADLVPDSMEPLRRSDPKTLGEYQLLGRLGAGGMGTAFLAERDHRLCVVKVFRSELTDNDSFGPRMARELEAMHRAAGVHTASVLEEHLSEHPAWFAMEYIAGKTLARRIETEGPLTHTELSRFAEQLSEAITHIHNAGLVHRDLKPSNIIVHSGGPRLIDFGIADLTDATQLTATGNVLGTIGWLAPEQVTGDPVTAATDLHAWALCVLFAATGNPPFGTESLPITMNRVLNETPSIPESIPAGLRAELQACLSKDPEQRRFADRRTNEPEITKEIALEPTMELKPPKEDPPMRPRRRRRKATFVAVGLIALATVGAGVAYAVTGSNGPSETVETAVQEVTLRPSLQTPSEPISPSPIREQSTESDALRSLSSPTGLRAVSRDGQVILRWEPVNGADEYVVEMLNGKQEYEVIQRVNNTQVNDSGLLTTRVAGLTNFQRYSFVVRAVSGDTEGPRSASVRVTPEPVIAEVSPLPTPTQTQANPPAGNQTSNNPPPRPQPTPSSQPTLVLEGDPNELVLIDE